MIKIITDMKTAAAQIAAVAGPKHVWWDINRVVVTTDTDMPLPTQEEENP